MRKFTLKTLLTALLLQCSTMATVQGQTFSNGYWSFRITDTTAKTVEITYYTYYSSYNYSINIPSTVPYNNTTYRVTSIGDRVFMNKFNLVSVSIPNSVTAIGDDAFEGCEDLTSITIPNSVTSIGSDAFYNCIGLKSVTIPNSVTSIGSGAFYNTVWYNNQPNGIVYAGKVLYGYKGIMPANTSITIGDSILGIAGRAFANYSNLTNVTIPNSVTSIGDYAFSNCSCLTGELVIPNSVTSIGQYAFNNCSGLTGELVIPNSVTSIGKYAFYGCKGLKSLYIGKAIESIGESAFAGCSKLFEIKIAAIWAITALESIFDTEVYNNAYLYVPTDRQYAYSKATPWSNFYIKEMDFESETENGSNITGDVNNDGAVNVADVTKLVNIILGNE
ncbi:MAG: cell surface protein [Bacteroidales bacterium]|nr:cell surface protein [Bacteroidales bacterium]